MFQPELFNQTDFGRIEIENIEGLIAGLKDEPSWRDHSGISAVSEWILLGWKYIVDNAERLDQDLVDSKTTISHFTSFATAWARLTRDLPAGLEKFQNALRPTISQIIKILWVTSAVARLDHPNFRPFNQFSVQALSNLNTLNPLSIAHTWPSLILCEDRQSILLRLLYTKNNRLLLIIGVLILNCVHHNPERIDSLINSNVGQKAMTMMLERLDGLLDDETEVVFEVIVKLVREIVDLEPVTQVPKLYHSQATPSQVLSPGQLSILKVLESSTVLPSASFLLEQFKQFSTHLDEAWQGFVLVIEILVKRIEESIATSSATGLSVELIMSDAEILSVVEISIRILKEFTEKRSELRASKDDQQGSDKKRSVNQILIGLIKLLTNLIALKNEDDPKQETPGSAFIQDAVRNLDGFPIILNFTLFDVDFPYLREHSIVLIKFLLKNNPKNQELIKNLQPILPS
ncbi:hypothetical protein PGT21_014685 [Puccinia graminis f. sp. tritici]|uniref:Ataxin-10 homolog n=1 Tax=Puccinia graminis f. sp. tritici TaxID=56615 RepID=A0A5B0MDA7_PUCGR|nr:hypothetical protein PGT21_014685 [Puccinia graminis f. sp. tritici]